LTQLLILLFLEHIMYSLVVLWFRKQEQSPIILAWQCPT